MRFMVSHGYVTIPEEFFGRGSGGGGTAGPAGPPGTPGSNTPLSNTVWVDKGTTVLLANQNGSIGAPYATLTQALNAKAGTTFTVLMTPGDYSAEGNIALLSAPNTAIAIVCLSAYYAIGAIAPEYSALLPAISGGDASQILHTVNCIFNSKNVNISGTFRTDFTRFQGTTTIGALQVTLNYCTVAGAITAGNGGGAGAGVVARNTFFSATGTFITTSSTLVVLYFCEFPAAAINITFSGGAGSVRVDSISNFWFKAATETITNGTKAVIGDLAA